MQTHSDASGNYTFSNLSLSGTYQIFETVAIPNACPPTVFTQPTGMTNSTTSRVIVLPISQAQINTNTPFANENFGHANVSEFGWSTEGILVSGTASATNLSTIE